MNPDDLEYKFSYESRKVCWIRNITWLAILIFGISFWCFIGIATYKGYKMIYVDKKPEFRYSTTIK